MIDIIDKKSKNYIKILAAFPIISSALIFFQNALLKIFITGFVVYFFYWLLAFIVSKKKVNTENRFVLTDDLLYYFIIFPLIIPAQLSIPAVVAAYIFILAAYNFQERLNIYIISPLLVGWLYTHLVFNYYFKNPEPSVILDKYIKFMPYLFTETTTATPMYLAFLDKPIILQWQNIMLGFSCGTAAEIFGATVLLAAFFMLLRKVLDFLFFLYGVLAFFITSTILYYFTKIYLPPPWYFIMLGAFLFSFIFILNDDKILPNDNSKKKYIAVLYGFLAVIGAKFFKSHNIVGYLIILFSFISNLSKINSKIKNMSSSEKM